MTDETVTEPVADRDEKGRFVTGNSGGPGKPQGARNKLGEQFVQALQQDFEKHGQAAIEAVRYERPQDYIKVIASLLPKEMVIRSELEDMTEDQLLERIRRLDAEIRPFLASRGAGEGTGPAPPATTH